MVAKNKAVLSRNTLRKNLRRKWLEERPNIFTHEELSLFTDLPEWVLLHKGEKVASGGYGGQMMAAIKKAAREQGVKL